MEQNLEQNEKVLAMYRAVYALLEEGRDIHTLKVADITGKAGIGKGTAYEYFRSKDELLKKALYYDLQMQCQTLTNQIKKAKTVKGALDTCFDWIENISERGRFAVQLMKLNQESQDSCNYSIKDKENPACQMLHQVLEHMVRIGKQDGTFSPEMPEEFAQLEVLSKCLAFYTYTLPEVLDKKLDSKVTRQFLYESIKNGRGTDE